MSKKKTALEKIETETIPEIESASQKGNTQRAITALIESLKLLVDHAKEANAALVNLDDATEVASEEKAPKPASKTPVKKTGGKPTPDMLKSPEDD